MNGDVGMLQHAQCEKSWMCIYMYVYTYMYIGDIVQLGSTTVFRFNHPGEAAEMKDYPNEASL